MTVVPFPRALGEAAQRAEEVEAERREFIRLVREAASDPARKLGDDDLILAARGIDRLIAEAKAEKITQHRIEQTASPDSKLHLERFRTDHAAPPAELKKRGTKGLNKKLADYVVLLDAIADLLGRDRDQVLADVFADTSYFQNAVALIDDPAVELKHLISAMVDSVVRVEHLSEYFDLCRRIPASFDSVTERFSASDLPSLYEPDLYAATS